MGMKMLAMAIWLILAVGGFAEEGTPRWVFLGGDDDLKRYFEEHPQVVTVCVYETELRNPKPPCVVVVLHATVAETFKGKLKPGDKIKIVFPSDSLPSDETEREKFINNAAKNNLGSLRIAFLSDGKDSEYQTEWLFVPKYQNEMREFLSALK
jgi:hypothetical protein